MKFKEYLNEGKFDKVLKNKDDLIKKYNAINKKYLKKGSLLPDLSDIEFFTWIVGKTYKHGRSFEDSVENAKYHMKNRKKAEKLFGMKKNDLFGPAYISYSKFSKYIDEAKKKKEYETKYCKKHKLEYNAYLHECPICAGEKMKLHKPKRKGKNET